MRAPSRVLAGYDPRVLPPRKAAALPLSAAGDSTPGRVAVGGRRLRSYEDDRVAVHHPQASEAADASGAGAGERRRARAAAGARAATALVAPAAALAPVTGGTDSFCEVF